MKLEHKGKNYKWIGDKWGVVTIGKQCNLRIGDAQVYFCFEDWSIVNTYHTPEQLVKLGYMEEVKENKEEETVLVKKSTIDEMLKKVSSLTAQPSVLEKLRELRNGAEDSSSASEGNCDCNFYLGKSQAFEEVIDLLTSLETPQFTPGQMIEVSNDGEKWKKRKFVENVPPNHDYLCEEYAFATRTWRFARPLEQVTIPEFDYEALCDLSYEKQPKNDDECDRLIVEGVGEHLEKITHFLHSQFPNSKK